MAGRHAVTLPATASPLCEAPRGTPPQVVELPSAAPCPLRHVGRVITPKRCSGSMANGTARGVGDRVREGAGHAPLNPPLRAPRPSPGPRGAPSELKGRACGVCGDTPVAPYRPRVGPGREPTGGCAARRAKGARGAITVGPHRGRAARPFRRASLTPPRGPTVRAPLTARLTRRNHTGRPVTPLRQQQGCARDRPFTAIEVEVGPAEPIRARPARPVAARRTYPTRVRASHHRLKAPRVPYFSPGLA